MRLVNLNDVHPLWRGLCNYSPLVELRKARQYDQVIAYLRTTPGANSVQIAEALSLAKSRVRCLLSKAENDGVIKCELPNNRKHGRKLFVWSINEKAE
jgi:predicted ArsR family transcriptional regulator